MHIAVTANSARTSAAKLLAAELNLPFIEFPDKTYEWLLMLNDNRLELQNNAATGFKPIYVDFLSGKLKHRQQFGGKELLARAIGIKGKNKPFVIDATAGLGTDAFVLANLGCRVQMIERSKIIAALLQDGLQRAKQNEELQHLQLDLIITDAITYLLNLRADKFPEVIYLDPMFPERSKSALVKKEMRMLRDIVGQDEDAADLLSIALQRASKRVIVKRPRLAPCISDIKPSFVLPGKSGRFDVYLITQQLFS